MFRNPLAGDGDLSRIAIVHDYFTLIAHLFLLQSDGDPLSVEKIRIA